MNNKQVWITGASSGIGRELALQLAARGDRVFVTARSGEALNSLAQESGGQLVPIVADVTDAAQLAQAGATIEQMAGRLDICIVNAGACEYLDVHDLDVEQLQQVFDVNVSGAARTVKVALPLLMKSTDAQLVAVSSMSTLVPFGRAQAYGASKAALEYFMRCCEIDLKARRIAVSVVRPGFVDTPLTKRNNFQMPFIIEAPEAARRMIIGIDARRRMVAFPRRLNWLLSFFRYTPWLWSRWLGPRLAGSAKPVEQ